jgi:SAM-dependent methyltransferase
MRDFPFRDDSSIASPDVPARRRLEKIQEFTTDLRTGGTTIADPCLDTGTRNWLIENLHSNALATWSDLNDGIPEFGTSSFATVTSFEVLEHLVNAGVFMTEVRRVLDPRGRIYLSTPLAHPLGILQSQHHFAEYRLSALLSLFEYSGLEVKDLWTWRTYPWIWIIRPTLNHFPFYSLRGFLRRLMSRTIIFELRRSS